MSDPLKNLDADLARVIADAGAKLEKHLAAPKPTAPAMDPAEVRRRWLADRAQVLLEGEFGMREVDRCRLEDPGRTLALDTARRFLAQHEKPILVLLGGVGCGKTTAATWIAREAGGSRPGKVLATVLERRGRYDREAAVPLMAWLDARTLVVLDDLGVEPLDSKGYFAALVDELADGAYSHHRRLVITSNASDDVLRERMGARVWSRIRQAAVVEGVHGPDLRRAGPLRSVS